MGGQHLRNIAGQAVGITVIGAAVIVTAVATYEQITGLLARRSMRGSVGSGLSSSTSSEQQPLAVPSPQPVWPQRWSVQISTDPMTDQRLVTAVRRAAALEGTYELEFRASQRQLPYVEAAVTLFDAAPLSTIFGKALRVRLDGANPLSSLWEQSPEFSNVGVLLDGSSPLGRWPRFSAEQLVNVHRRILMQGLRSPDEYLEFVIDDSYEPFRTHLQGLLAAREAEIAAADDARRAAEDARRKSEEQRAAEEAMVVAAKDAERRRIEAERAPLVQQRIAGGMSEQMAQAYSLDELRALENQVPPKALREVRPMYTAEAMRNKITGAVRMVALVGTDGTVLDARITQSLDQVYGLDKEALVAVRQWRFTPATLNGAAVEATVIIELTFSLR